MHLAEHFRNTGTRFFRWRSWLPYLLVPPYGLSLLDFRYGAGPAADRWWTLLCLGVAAVGLGLRLRVSGTAPPGTSGRSANHEAATLNTAGLYSVVRHPMYLGNFLVGLGLTLIPRAWYLPLLYTLAFALYYERIIFVEEAYLDARFGEAFRSWAARVPGFVPRTRGHRPAALPYRWRAALRREFYAMSFVMTAFGTVDVLMQLAVAGRWRPDPVWTSLFALGVAFFVVMRTLKKRTAVLKVEGR